MARPTSTPDPINLADLRPLRAILSPRAAALLALLEKREAARDLDEFEGFIHGAPCPRCGGSGLVALGGGWLPARCGYCYAND